MREPHIKLRVELKIGPGRVPYRGVPSQVAEALRDRKMLERSILTSFQLETVGDAVARARPHQSVFLLTPDLQTDLGLAAICAAAKARHVPMLGVRWNRLDAQVVGEVRAAGLGIGGWAANDEAAIGKMLGLGVDVFTTDRPDLALKAREAMRVLTGPHSAPVRA